MWVFILLSMNTLAAFSQIKVSGTVTDNNKEALIGVNVKIIGSKTGTITDINGNYSIQATDSKSVIAFSYIGYKTIVQAVGSSKKLDIVMEQDSKTIDEVVVVAYGTQQKSHLTGAVSSIKGEKMDDIPVSNIGQALQGKLAGVTINQFDPEAGEAPTIRVRGLGSISADSGPLVVVDGFPIPDGLASVSMGDVESIEVLKDAASASLYGSRAAGGVILVTTKSGNVAKPKYNFKMYTGVRSIMKLNKMLTNNEYVQLLYDEAALRMQDPAVDGTIVILVLRNSVTKLRIANNTGSGLYLYKIQTLTYQQATDLTLRSSSPTEGEVCYSNLKKSITLTFNKNVSLASGTILLNGVSIPLNSCVLTDNTVNIPVNLTTTAGSNKNYTLSISTGAFAEMGNLTNLSKAITVNFQALKSVAYPSNYNGLMDVVYKNVNSTNCRMDIYYPTDAANPVPVVINMHGGGWVSGFKEDQGGFSMYFNQGWAVANVEYRMRNEILAPAAVEDVRGAMQYLLNHADELHIDRNKIIFQGGSAGGHLALTGGYLQNNRIYDNDCQQYAGNIKVMAVIDKYGAADLMTFAPVYPGMVIWLGSRYTDSVFVKSLSPYEMIDANTPPTYIIHGDADPTIPYTQSVRLQAKLQAAGVKNKFLTVPGGLHGGFPDAYNTQMETEVIAFLGEVINTLTTSSEIQSENNKTTINLTGNSLRISSNEKTLTSVFDCMGKLLVQSQENTIKLNQSGLFIVKVKTAQSESNYKVIIK